MGKTVRVDTEINEELLASLQRLADRQGGTRDQLIEHAVRLLVESEERFAAAVQEGVEALDAGDVIDHRDVETAFTTKFGSSP
ncbi:putative transcriptional regulator [Azospirillum lipoferum]|uniref:Ribbon-helix-helix protein, CopG family n=1 Tax=Azospirillum lipoferum TaxID=193 RepID=A0A5A9GM99_AZOLI|nr:MULTISPECIES: ribbon-helix-helix protein, CopG family [Azospirillum]KAA0594704.1 ribbon-helix-helix protein, CopG family [Azospirillum lipoferum]MCP1612988.1 putative transcriptional regulator [Azospirillum lipoferum]MDW5532822.1 ribbon-helix-helix protein, CopG family [Azospirillum sp. NL1]